MQEMRPSYGRSSATACLSIIILSTALSFLLTMMSMSPNSFFKGSHITSATDVSSEPLTQLLGNAGFNTPHRAADGRQLKGADRSQEEADSTQKEADSSQNSAEAGKQRSGGAHFGSLVLNPHNFDLHVRKYPVVLVDFYASWCGWSRRLEPVWEEASRTIHQRYDPNSDGRIRLSKIDCAEHEQICSLFQIDGFPSIRVFRNGSDVIGGGTVREEYNGENEVAPLIKFAESLVSAVAMQSKEPPKED